jgi:hypothetical protein
LGLTAYRIPPEALTSTLKHAKGAHTGVLVGRDLEAWKS